MKKKLIDLLVLPCYIVHPSQATLEKELEKELVRRLIAISPLT